MEVAGGGPPRLPPAVDAAADYEAAAPQELDARARGLEHAERQALQQSTCAQLVTGSPGTGRQWDLVNGMLLTRIRCVQIRSEGRLHQRLYLSLTP